MSGAWTAKLSINPVTTPEKVNTHIVLEVGSVVKGSCLKVANAVSAANNREASASEM